MPDVVVVGAGVIGTTTALYLAREGLSVTVVDAAAGSADATSFANGGLLAAGGAMPWTSPDAPGLLARWIGREDAPLLLRPSTIPRLGLWGLKFLANCRPSKYARTAQILTRFARESLDETEGLGAQQVVDFRLSYGGLIELFRSEAGIAERDRTAEEFEKLGVPLRRLDGPAAVALEPQLAPIAPTIRAGLLFPDDAWGDARRFTRAAEAAARRLSVEFAFNVEVRRIEGAPSGTATGVVTTQGRIEAKSVVVAAGAAAKRLLWPLGIQLPIEPVKGYSLTVPRAELGLLPNRPIVDVGTRIVATPLDDALRVAGTVEFAGYDTRLRERRVENLLRALAGLFPDAPRPQHVQAWTGLRPMSADSLPIVDGTPVTGLYVNAGHGALGWTLACASARLLSDIVVGRARKGQSPFALTRSFW